MEKLIIAFIALLIGIVIFSAWYDSSHCIKYRTEKQFQAPMYMNPGTDGGVSIPLSNGKWVDVKVCEEYRK